MVTWGNNTTAVFGKSTPANAPTTPAPANGSAFSFGAAPSTPPLTSTTPAVNPPPLSGSIATGSGAPPAPTAPTAAANNSSGGGGGFSFGGSSIAPTAGGGLFGSSSAPAPSGGLFGSTTTPAPATTTTGGGLFGSTPAPAPSTSLFGAPTTVPPATAQSTSIFGAQQQQPQPQQYQYNQNPQAAALHAHQTASQHQETARIEEAIYNLHSKYSVVASDPRNVALASNNMPSSLCAFTAILYDPLAPEHRTTNSATATSSMMGGGAGVGGRGGGHLSAPKPPHISNQVWNEALARNPDPNELCPVPLIGATSLHSRLISQQEKANALSTHATQLRSTLDFLSKTATQSSNAIQFHLQKQTELNHRLLELMRKIEIIRCMNQPIQDAESKSNYQLRVLYEEVNRMIRVLCDLEERGREQARLWRKRGATGGVGDGMNVGGVNNGGVDNTSSSLEEEDKLALFHVLNDQRLGMERLGSIVTRDVRDVDILKEEMGKALDQGRGSGSVGGVRQQRGGVVGTTAIFGGR